MRITIDLTPGEELVLLELTRSLQVAPEVLARAAVRDFLLRPSAEFRAAADHILERYDELHRRLE